MAKNNTFTINGKKINALPFDFNLVCDLDDMGIAVNDIHDKQNAFLRAYISLCLGVSKEVAGAEIQAHIIGGGTFEDAVEAIIKELNDSDFFQALTKNAAEKN